MSLLKNSDYKWITLFDPEKVDSEYICLDNCLTEASVGRRRDEAVSHMLSELNTDNTIDYIDECSLVNTIPSLKNYDVVLITEYLPQNILGLLIQSCEEGKIPVVYSLVTDQVGFGLVINPDNDSNTEWIIYMAKNEHLGVELGVDTHSPVQSNFERKITSQDQGFLSSKDYSTQLLNNVIYPCLNSPITKVHNYYIMDTSNMIESEKLTIYIKALSYAVYHTIMFYAFEIETEPQRRKCYNLTSFENSANDMTTFCVSSNDSIKDEMILKTKHLVIDYPYVSTKVLKKLKYLKNLVSIRLGANAQFNGDKVDVFFKAIRKLENLQELDISGTILGTSYIEKYLPPSVKKLNISRTMMIQLRLPKTLEQIEISGIKIKKENLQNYNNLKKIIKKY
jgi:hypothetical protein